MIEVIYKASIVPLSLPMKVITEYLINDPNKLAIILIFNYNTDEMRCLLTMIT